MPLDAKQFAGWSKGHRRKYLKAAGVTGGDFRQLDPDEKNALLRKARREIIGKPAPKAAKPTRADLAKAALNDPQTLLTSLTPKQVNRQAQSQADVKYDPTIKTAQGEVRVSQEQGRRIQGWFGQYQQDLAAAKASNAEAFQGAADQINANAAAAQTQDATATAAQQAALQADAASRGAVVDPTLAATAQQASAARQASSNATVGQVVSGKANQAVFDTGASVSASKARIEQGLRELATRKGLRQDVRDLKQEKRAFRIGARADLVTAERKSQLENAAFGLNQQEAAASAAEAAAKLQQDAKENRQNRRDKAADRAADAQKDASKVNTWGYTNAEWTSMSPGERESIIKQQKGYGKTPKDKTAPTEPASSLKIRQGVAAKKTFVDQYGADHPVLKTKAGRAQMVAALRKTHPGMFSGVNQKLLSAALDQYFDGHIGASNLDFLRTAGAQVGPKGKYRPKG